MTWVDYVLKVSIVNVTSVNWWYRNWMPYRNTLIVCLRSYTPDLHMTRRGFLPLSGLFKCWKYGLSKISKHLRKPLLVTVFVFSPMRLRLRLFTETRVTSCATRPRLRGPGPWEWAVSLNPGAPSRWFDPSTKRLSIMALIFPRKLSESLEKPKTKVNYDAFQIKYSRKLCKCWLNINVLCMFISMQYSIF